MVEVICVCRRSTTTTICNELEIDNLPKDVMMVIPINLSAIGLRTGMDISKLSLKESWFLSEECKKLTEYSKNLVKKDDLSPCDIEAINNSMPDEHQHPIIDRM